MVFRKNHECCVSVVVAAAVVVEVVTAEIDDMPSQKTQFVAQFLDLHESLSDEHRRLIQLASGMVTWR